jgi:hypothetical protein
MRKEKRKKRRKKRRRKKKRCGRVEPMAGCGWKRHEEETSWVWLAWIWPTIEIYDFSDFIF